MSKRFSRGDVASHSKPEDLWIIIDREVFNISTFQHEHPGGKQVLRGVAGKDATKKFKKYHREALLNQYREELQVGSLDTDAAEKPSRPGLSFGFLRPKDRVG